MSVASSLAYFLIRGCSGALGVVAVAIYARLLGPSGYAVWSIVIVLSALMTGVLLQPIHSALGRFLPQAGYDGLGPNLGRMVVVAILFSALAAGLLESLGPSWIPSGAALLAIVVGAGQGIFEFSAQYSASRLRPQQYGFLYLAKAVTTVTLGSLLLLAGFGVWGAAAAGLCACLAATALFGMQAWRGVFLRSSAQDINPEVRRYMLPLVAATLTSTLLQWGDRLILAAYVPRDQLGAYSAAGDLVQQGIGLLLGSLHLAWFPRLVAAWGGGGQDFQSWLNRYAQAALVVTPPVTAGLVLVANDFLSLVVGPIYNPQSTMVLPGLVIAAVLNGARMYFFDLPLHLSKQMTVQFAVTAAAAGTAIALNLAFVPRYGLLAAVAVAVSTQAVACVASLYLGRNVLKPSLRLRDIVAVVSGTCGIILVVSAIPEGGAVRLASRVLAGAIVYGLMLLAFDAARGRRMLADFLRRVRRAF